MFSYSTSIFHVKRFRHYFLSWSGSNSNSGLYGLTVWREGIDVGRRVDGFQRPIVDVQCRWPIVRRIRRQRRGRRGGRDPSDPRLTKDHFRFIRLFGGSALPGDLIQRRFLDYRFRCGWRIEQPECEKTNKAIRMINYLLPTRRLNGLDPTWEKGSLGDIRIMVIVFYCRSVPFKPKAHHLN